MPEGNNTKLLTVNLDMTTYERLIQLKKNKTWLEFLQFVSQFDFPEGD